MTVLPWITTEHPQFAQLIHTVNGSKMLIDPQRHNADAMATLWTAYQLCLSEDKPCGHCQSCHLLSLHTHPDNIFHTEACSIDKIRQVIDQVHTTPTIASVRAVYLGSIDQYNPHAINALLKTLEEPPQYSRFLLSASSRRAVKPTVLSRTQTLSMPKPTQTQSLQWLVNEHQLSEAEAQRRLNIHADNPFAALTNKELPAIEENVEACLGFLVAPNQHPEYLMLLEDLPADSVVDFVTAQIALIINDAHFNDPSDNLNSDRCQSFLETINLVNLHSLYAKLTTLRRPDQQQTNALLSVKSILLQSMKQRSLST